MTVEDATKIGAMFAALISSLLGLLTWQTMAKKTQAETTEQRVAREEAEATAKQQRLDDGVWRIITKLEADVVRLTAKSVETDGTVAALRETITTLREENINVRADLAQAKYTITRLSGENEQLKSRVQELESHPGPNGGC